MDVSNEDSSVMGMDEQGIVGVQNKKNEWIPEVEPKPEKGLKFRSYHEAYVFYKDYAKKAGFEVRKSTTIKMARGVGYSHKYVVCAKEGKKAKVDMPTIIYGKNRPRNRPSPRVGCKAMVKVKFIRENVYDMYHVNLIHNHPFVHPDDSKFLKSERRLTYTQKQLVNDLSSINMGPNKAFNVLKQSRGGYDKVGVTVVECKNFKRDLIAFVGENDADMVVNKLLKKQEYLTDFSFQYSVDSDSTLTGLFWADEEAKRNYKAFGDVVGFDATFRTNKYFMVFVPFTGIDNHKRCVTFGCGLLSSETIESYEWLLTEFKKTFDKEPLMLITDQCPSLKQAIPKVFPNVKHRLCMWHICNKFAGKLGTNLAKTGILKQLNDIVWDDQLSVSAFEAEWTSIMNQYDLQSHDWLKRMYNLREEWIPAYFGNCPLSGMMQTTSRSEGSNYFFGLISNVDLHLIEFLNNFDTAMEAQRCAQRKNDHDSRYTIPDLKCLTQIERDASELFTRTVFYDIQGEMIASMMKCMSTSLVQTDELSTFTIKDLGLKAPQHTHFAVSYNQSDGTILCSCNRYVLHGTFCRHCFYVFRMLGIDEFPNKYVLTRWLKDVATQTNPDIRANRNKILGGGDELNSMVRDIYGIVDSCLDRLVTNMEDLSLYKDKQQQLKIDVEKNTSVMPPMSNREVIASYYGLTSNEEITLKTPKGIRNKGCGPYKKRMIGEKEKAIEKTKKSRTCSLCRLPSHNARSCPKMPAPSASK